MKHPALVVPDAMSTLTALGKVLEDAGVPLVTRKLVHVRASQMNGCGACLDLHSRELREAGDTDERIFGIAAWRDMPYYTEAERAALALTEASTELGYRTDAVPDELWNECARHYEEPALAALVLEIATINLWNRLSVPTRQQAGRW